MIDKLCAVEYNININQIMGGVGMSEQTNDISVLTADREKTIVRTSIIGIIANVLLAAFKAFVGLMSHSIAVVLDAVNNL